MKLDVLGNIVPLYFSLNFNFLLPLFPGAIVELQSCAKIFGKSMFFSFLGIYGLISPPTPISMLKNVISVLREIGSLK